MKKKYSIGVPGFMLMVLASFNGNAQTNISGLGHLFTEPAVYTAHFLEQPLVIDGRIDEPAWQVAPWSAVFTDIEGDLKPRPTYPTRMKMIWNDTCLFIAAELTEPDVWASLRNHDDIVFHDNDFEVFIDPDNNTESYYEIEVNAFNTIFDLLLTRPYRNGGLAIIDWDLKGLRSAINIQGSLNDPRSKDKGWTVEMAIPFKSVTGANQRAKREEQLWRINFSRVEWDVSVADGRYERIKDPATGRFKPEHNWVWSPQGVINMHFPERWGYLRFSRGPSAAFTLPLAEKQKKYLWISYYRQKEFFGKNRRYALSLPDIGFADSTILIDGLSHTLSLEGTSRQFMVYITGGDNATWSINQDGLVQPIRPR